MRAGDCSASGPLKQKKRRAKLLAENELVAVDGESLPSRSLATVRRNRSRNQAAALPEQSTGDGQKFYHRASSLVRWIEILMRQLDHLTLLQAIWQITGSELTAVAAFSWKISLVYTVWQTDWPVIHWSILIIHDRSMRLLCSRLGWKAKQVNVLC